MKKNLVLIIVYGLSVWLLAVPALAMDVVITNQSVDTGIADVRQKNTPDQSQFKQQRSKQLLFIKNTSEKQPFNQKTLKLPPCSQ